MVWFRSTKKDEEQRPFEVGGKEIFSNRSKQAKSKAGEKTDKKGGKGQSVRWKEWWRQGNIKCAVSEEKAAGVSGGKDESRVSSAIERERIRLLHGHRGRHAWRLWVSGPSNGR